MPLFNVKSDIPAGSDTYIQFNDNGVFGGDAGFTFNKTTDVISTQHLLPVTDALYDLGDSSLNLNYRSLSLSNQRSLAGQDLIGGQSITSNQSTTTKSQAYGFYGLANTKIIDSATSSVGVLGVSSSANATTGTGGKIIGIQGTGTNNGTQWALSYGGYFSAASLASGTAVGVYGTASGAGTNYAGKFDGRILQTINGNDLNDFTITGSRTTRQTDFDNLFNLTPTYSWTGADTGVAAIIRAINVTMADTRTVNATGGVADYFRIMDFQASRTGSNSASLLNLISPFFMQWRDLATYSMAGTATNKVRLFEVSSQSTIASIYTGTGTKQLEWASLYVDSPSFSIDATTGPVAQFNALIYGSYVVHGSWIASGATAENIKFFGLYYGTAQTTAGNMNYAVYARNGHIALTRDSNAVGGGKLQFGAGANAAISQGSTAYVPDTEVYFSGTNWVFDVVTVTTGMSVVWNESGADCNFRIEGDADANLLFIDAGLNSIGIGTETPTAFLHLKAPTASIATTRWPPGTAPTSPNGGDMWNDSTQRTLTGFFNGITNVFVGTLFTSTANATVVSTGAETTIIGTGVGTLSLPADFFVAGKTLRVRASGYFSTAVVPDSLNILFYIGTTMVIQTTAKTPAGSVTSEGWAIDILLTCRTTGASGTVIAQGEFRHGDDTTANDYNWYMISTATATINTTITEPVYLRADYTVGSASDSITCTNFILETLN